MLTHTHVKNTFEAARKTDSKFVFVSVIAEGIEEIIAIPKESFDAKEAFYLRSYSEEGLVHVMNSNVYIRGLSYGSSTELDIIA